MMKYPTIYIVSVVLSMAYGRGMEVVSLMTSHELHFLKPTVFSKKCKTIDLNSTSGKRFTKGMYDVHVHINDVMLLCLSH